MKHPITGPRTCAILLIFSAGFISSKFFSKPVDNSPAVAMPQADEVLTDPPVGLPAAANSIGSGVARNASAEAPLNSTGPTVGDKLPSWAHRQSRLDRLIESGPAPSAKPTIEVQLEPLATWISQPPTTQPTAGAPSSPAAEISNPGRSPSEISVGYRRSPEATRTLPEEVEAHELSGQALPDSPNRGVIAQYRSSPWESSERFQQTTGQWQSVGAPPDSGWSPTADSTPIHWPDEQIATDQLDRIRSLNAAPEQELPEQGLPEQAIATQHMTASNTNWVGSARLQPWQLEQQTLPTSASQDTQSRRFLFQPGIRSRP